MVKLAKLWYNKPKGDFVSLKEEIEIDIKQFFRQIESCDSNTQIELLRMLLHKYSYISTSTFLMDNHDLNSIISGAKLKFANDSFPIHLGERKVKVTQGELPNLCVIESTIAHLNKNDCLKKIPKFDKREE